MEVSVASRPRREVGLGALRRAADVVGAGVLLLALLPVLAAAALAVVLASGRPVFFGHRRVGRSGRSFRCWKLRTMEVGAEERLEEEPELRLRYVENGFKIPETEDPRLTPVGRWLRRRYIDEIPQLLNVLNGTMSLVGPRPLVEEEIACFGDDAGELLGVNPGIVGAWTSLGHGRPDYPERAGIELEYVRTRSTATDLRILLRSVGVVLRAQRKG